MPQTKLTAKEIGDLKGRLDAERAELSDQLTTIEEETFAASQSELSGDVGLDDESADAGTATFEREKDLSIENNVRDLLGKIDRALKRIDDGSYGTCERCGKPIEKARIKALPYVDLCIKDAQARSRRSGPWTARGAAVRSGSSAQRGWSSRSIAARRSGQNSGCPATPSRSSPGCSPSGSRRTPAARSASGRTHPGSSRRRPWWSRS
jgi:DnaK suppressor protein